MLAAINSSAKLSGTVKIPNDTSAKVTLWPTVKDDRVQNRGRPFRTKSTSARIKSRWSAPLRMCSTPSGTYILETPQKLGALGTEKTGCAAVRDA
jgi:hypothetical protein